MTIHFYRTKRKVNALNKVKDVYVATIEIGETMDIDEISEQIEKISTVSKADILAVLDAIGYWAQVQLSKGCSVKMEGLCTLTPTVHCKSAATADDLDLNYITRLGVRCTMSSELKKKIKDCTKSITEETNN